MLRIGVGTELCRILLDEAQGPPVRQLAGVILRQVADKHWESLPPQVNAFGRPLVHISSAFAHRICAVE